ncbi:membrane protein [Cryobacterium roopkundense]|uniref:Membrane protein n=1 Tax=Cryobacterium roopkundense TaxID=1001240 RepID=A0A099JIR4_9MICO|nr:membrane protein [Cryobacterium roopkundense]
MREWRVVDIIVASVVSVAVGVIFWAWSAGYAGIAVLTAAFPPLGGLYGGGWLIAGVIGALVIRKPGAALFCEVLAAVVEAMLGSAFGLGVIIAGLVQGVGAELVFAAVLYRRFTLPVALLAGAVSGAFMGVHGSVTSHVAWALEWKAVYVALGAVSGAFVAGLLSWLAVRALSRTGALTSLASRRAHTERAL